MVGYNIEFGDVDRNIAKTRGVFYPTDQYDTAEETLTEFQADVKSVLTKYRNKYQRLYEAEKLKYEPIENYNMIESGSDDRTVDLTDTNSLGTVKTTDNQGEINQTNGYGAVRHDDSVQPHEDTKTIGFAGANADTYKNGDKNVDSYGKLDSSHTEAGRSDTFNQKAVENSQTREQLTADVLKHGGTDNLSHTLTRHGNIGVTTSQQMLESEVALWRNFNWYSILIDDIIHELCNFHDPGVEPFEMRC